MRIRPGSKAGRPNVRVVVAIHRDCGIRGRVRRGFHQRVFNAVDSGDPVRSVMLVHHDLADGPEPHAEARAWRFAGVELCASESKRSAWGGTRLTMRSPRC